MNEFAETPPTFQKIRRQKEKAQNDERAPAIVMNNAVQRFASPPSFLVP